MNTENSTWLAAEKILAILDELVAHAPSRCEDTRRYLGRKAGSRRLEAAKAAHLEEVPVVVAEKLTDLEAFKISLAENAQRKNLSIQELSDGFSKLRMTDPELSEEEFGKIIGKSQEWVSRILSASRIQENPLERADLRKVVPDAQSFLIRGFGRGGFLPLLLARTFLSSTLWSSLR